jgi:hypothetical protein
MTLASATPKPNILVYGISSNRIDALLSSSAGCALHTYGVFVISVVIFFT